MHVEHAARAYRVRVPLADALGETAAVGDVAEHRLALGHRVAHFETSAAVRLRAAEEVEVGQHRIGAFNQGNVGAIDPSRLLARINQVHRHFLVEWEQPLDAELRAQGRSDAHTYELQSLMRISYAVL